MANVVRKKFIDFYSREAIDGMYIYKKSNIIDIDIPQLPIIYSTDKKDIFYINFESEQIEIIASELNDHFKKGDILEIDNKHKKIRTVLSSLSNENTLLLTEQCENRCLFCSQPPNYLPDIHLYNRATMALLNYNSGDLIGITGGEPTINRDAFIGMLKALESFGNTTPLHILSNGRNLGDMIFYADVMEQAAKRSIIWGIPLYGHKSSLHDMIVGSKGAFNDTLNGLLNLSSSMHDIELRIVIVKQNYKFLEYILDFINHSFPNIRTISLMNLEPVGWAKKNYEELYISVEEQNKYLTALISKFNILRFDIKLLNYPLCLLNEKLRPYAVKSISDWKNYYPEECNLCIYKHECCGYFSSADGVYLEKPKVIDEKN